MVKTIVDCGSPPLTVLQPSIPDVCVYSVNLVCVCSADNCISRTVFINKLFLITQYNILLFKLNIYD